MRMEQRVRATAAAGTVLGAAAVLGIATALVVALVATRSPDLRDRAPVAADRDTRTGPGMVVCGTAVVEPSTFPERCGSGSTTFNNLRWATWTSRGAFGVGEYWVNDLKVGTSESHPVRLQLSRPTSPSERGTFRRLTVTFAAQDPDSARGHRLLFDVHDDGLSLREEDP